MVAKCAYCEAETELYVFGRPTCIECCDLMEAGKPPKKKTPEPEKSTPKTRSAGGS